MRCSKCRNGRGKYRRRGRTVPCPRCQPKPSPDAINVGGRWYVPAETSRPSLYEKLKAKGAGYCPGCGTVVTPDDIMRNPVRPAPVETGGQR